MRQACRWCKLLVEKLTYELLIEGTNVYNSNNFSKSGFSTFLRILIFQPRLIKFIVGDSICQPTVYWTNCCWRKRKNEKQKEENLSADEVTSHKMHYKLTFNFSLTTSLITWTSPIKNMSHNIHTLKITPIIIIKGISRSKN